MSGSIVLWENGFVESGLSDGILVSLAFPTGRVHCRAGVLNVNKRKAREPGFERVPLRSSVPSLSHRPVEEALTAGRDIRPWFKVHQLFRVRSLNSFLPIRPATSLGIDACRLCLSTYQRALGGVLHLGRSGCVIVLVKAAILRIS